jgi:hypothetical protein
MNAQENRTLYAGLVPLMVAIIRTGKTAPLPADLTAIPATQAEPTSATRGQVTKHIAALVGQAKSPAYARGIMTALLTGDSKALATAIEAPSTYTPNSSGKGEGFTCTTLARVAGTGTLSEWAGGNRKRPLSRAEFADLKVQLGRKGDGKTQAEYIELGYMTADGKAIKPEPARVKFGTLKVADTTDTPEGLNEFVKTLMDAGMSHEDMIVAIRQYNA